MEFVYPTVSMIVLGALIGVILSFASKKFAVEVDTRVEDVRALLPGLNCGACGTPGCDAMAQMLVNGEIDVSRCRPSNPTQKEAIKQYLAENK
ncbi:MULTISPECIES: (Fe-S)-binding protein [Terrabacteria group]|uniref:(Fe-S)-binding protein n=1 Tax=Bacillati TaxID=1783272 RepID=UPI00193A9AA7|nr:MULTISPECIES: (Fe-S)-binding protein [Terrabacteria group]MBW9212149.1 hypothetical protein [Trueperella sp. zg.1013]QRG86306.1 electron transporter RnfB [Bulleidia sp. zg-1006]